MEMLNDFNGLENEEDEEEEEEEEEEDSRFPVVVEGQGTVLQQNTRNAMQNIINRHAVNMEEVDLWVQDITAWFTAMLDYREHYPASIWEERALYFRALFNLTTDRATRLRLVCFKACGLMTRMTEHLISMPELDNPNIAVMVAAIANVVYEEPTKREMTQEHKAAELLTKLLKNPTPNVLTHAARGVFSLTTVFDFKKIFATQEGLLASLVDCLKMDPEELITNAAGALANIAIHPESKLPIANNGSLEILINLAKTHQSESVLHQTSRCLFSLAAEKSNRPKMVQQGVLEAVTRLIGSSNVEVLANIIGCLGNLCMSECEAQAIVNVDRLLAILHKSETVVLDRQTTRILHSFAYRKELLPKFTNQLDSLLNKFNTCSEENVVRDLSGMFVNIIENNAELRTRCCAKQAFARCVALFRQLGGVMDTMATLSRFTYLLSHDALAIEWAGKNVDQTLQLFSKLTEPPSQRLVAQFSFGVLGNLALDADMAKLFGEQDQLLKRAHSTLFDSDSRGKRCHASKFLVNTLHRQREAFQYIAEYGGNNGDRKRYMDDMRSLFRNTFSCNVYKDESLQQSQVALPGGLRQVIVHSDVEGQVLVIHLFAPFIEHCFPKLFDNIKQAPGASAGTWTFLFEFLSTRDWTAQSNVTRDSALLASTCDLVKTLGLDTVVSELEKIRNGHLGLSQQKKEAELFFREESGFEEESTLLSGIGFPVTIAQEFSQWADCDVFFRLALPADKVLVEVYEDMLDLWKVAAMTGDETVVIGAHRHLLMARSPYFHALFRNPWRDHAKRVYDLDIPLEHFLLMFRFMYFGLDTITKELINQDRELARALLDEASKYMLRGLSYYCELSLCKLLSTLPVRPDGIQLAIQVAHLNAPFLKLDIALNYLARKKDWLGTMQQHTMEEIELLKDVMHEVGMDSTLVEIDEGEENSDAEQEGSGRKRQRLEEEPPHVDLNGVFL